MKNNKVKSKLKYLLNYKVLVSGLLLVGLIRLGAMALGALPYYHTYLATVIVTNEVGEKKAAGQFYTDHLFQMGNLTCFRNLELNHSACLNDVLFEFVEVDPSELKKNNE